MAASEDELVDASLNLVQHIRESTAGSVDKLAALAGASAGEVWASPFGVRAVAMGVNAGAWCVPHDLRALLPSDEVPESVQDPDHGIWDRGVLLTGKYQSFQHDDPLLTRNPIHMARWTGHEMLHRAGGFWWSPEVGRWELYLGARLNELVPVVHWYTTDSFLRTTNDGFDRVGEGTNREIEISSVKWLNAPLGELEGRVRSSVHLLRDAVRHFEEEIADILQEIETGQIIARPRAVGDSALLNASSDAIAYVVGHIERLKHKNVGAVLTNLPEIAPWYDRSVRAYLERTERLFDELLFGTVVVDEERVSRLRLERQRWDLVLRAAHHPQTRHGRLRMTIQELVEGNIFAREGVIAIMRNRLGEEVAGFAACDGNEPNDVALEQLEDGLRSFAPMTVERLQALDIYRAVVADFVRDGVFYKRLSLPERFELFLRATMENSALVELLRFERMLAEGPASDVGAETVALDLDEDEITHEAKLVLSKALRSAAFSRDVLAWYDELQENPLADEPDTCEQFRVLFSTWRDEVQVVPAPRGVAALVDILESGSPVSVNQALVHLSEGELVIESLDNEWPEDPEAWLTDLVAAGVLIARPSVG